MSTTEQTIVKAAGPGDFLAIVPALLGFTPRNSAVLVPFNGSRTIGAMRVDLPPAASTDEVAATLIGYICRVQSVTGVAVVLYTDADAASVRPLGDLIVKRADQCGLEVIDGLYVATEGWGRLRSEDAPRSLDEIRVPDSLAGSVAADQAEASAAAPLSPERAAMIAESGAAFDPDAADYCAAFERLCAVPDPTEVTAEDAALLMFVLERPMLRDVALVQWASDRESGEAALPAQLGYAIGVDVPEMRDAVRVLAGEAARPTPARLTNALAIVRHVSDAALTQPRAGSLAVSAWLAWGLGRSSLASKFAREAVELDAEHGLAKIVATLCELGHLPSWVYLR